MAKRKKAEYGDGSVYRNQDGTWTAAVRLKAGAKPTRRRAPDQQSAEVVRQTLLKMRERSLVEDAPTLDAALDTLTKLHDKSIDVDGATTAFDVFINRWFNEVVKMREGITDRTLDHYRGIIRRYLIPEFSDTPLVQIKAPDVLAFLNRLRKHLAPSHVKQVYSALRQAFDTAVGWHFLTYNPCAGVEAPKVKRAELPALTVAQMRQLYAIVEDHPTAPIWHVMGTLGTRLGETLALRRTDFNADFSEVKIASQISYHTLKRTAPKDDSARPLPIPPRLQARLAAQWALVCQQDGDPTPNFQNSGLLFPSEAGTPFQPSNIEKLWHGYTQWRQTKQGRKRYVHPGFKERAALPAWATIHSLRTFVATMLEDVGAEQRTTGHILGHGAKNVTEKYIKKHIPTMRRALEALETLIWSEAEDQSIAM